MSLNPPNGLLCAFQTVRDTYLVAKDFGAGDIKCKSTQRGEWELFRIYIIDEEPPLKHGCKIVIQSSGSPRDGVAPKYWSAPNSDWIWAEATQPINSAIFKVHKLNHEGADRPEITNGMWIQLEKPNIGWVAADPDGLGDSQIGANLTKDNGFARLKITLY